MTPSARKTYFRLWNAACAVKGWNSGDDDLRRAVVIECMEKVRGPLVTTSSPEFGADETTALFVYLDHLAHPSDLLKAAAWVDCMTDYRAYNRARQADWHEEKAYGKAGSGKLRRNRFAGQKKAAGEALDPLDPAAIQKRFLTMRTRNERRTGYQSKKRQSSAGQNLASTPPAAPVEAEDERIPW
jgi:hypothetical protein